MPVNRPELIAKLDKMVEAERNARPPILVDPDLDEGEPSGSTEVETPAQTPILGPSRIVG